MCMWYVYHMSSTAAASEGTKAGSSTLLLRPGRRAAPAYGVPTVDHANKLPRVHTEQHQYTQQG